MPVVTELELPEFEFMDPTLSGERYHELFAELADKNWLARAEIGYFVLDREAGELFLRTRSARFPGLEIAEMFGVDEGPLAEEMRRNILHLDGDDHRRLRQLVNPSSHRAPPTAGAPSCASSSSSCGSRSPSRGSARRSSSSASPTRR